MGRAPCCEKVGLNRGPWTRDEDMRLIQYIKSHGEGCWRTLPKAAGLLRCGKSCRLRWINYLRPDLKRGNISEEEDRLIIKLHSLLGNRWSLIAGNLPGRTDNEIKNYWNTHLKKKLRNMGIDPQTHLPLSQEKPTTIINSKGMMSNPNYLNNKNHNYNVNPLTHQLNTSLIGPPYQLIKNNGVFSSKAKPLDMNPPQLDPLKVLPFDTHLTSTNILCPHFTSSLLATTHDNPPPPLTNFLSCPSSSSISSSILSTFDHSLVGNYASDCNKFASSSSSSSSSSSPPPPLSMSTLTNSSSDCNIESFSMLGNLYQNPSHISTTNASLINYNYSFYLPSASSLSLVMSSTTSLSSSSSPSPPLLKSTTSPLAKTLSSSLSSSSSPLATRTSQSSLSSFAFMDASTEASYIGYHNKSISKTLEDANVIEYDKECMKKIEGMMDEVGNTEREDNGGYHCGDTDHAKHESIVKECGLSLLEGEFMWDMEIMCSFEEVGSPTRSSMLTCLSSYSLWGHDTSDNHDGASVPTWLNVGDDQ